MRAESDFSVNAVYADLCPVCGGPVSSRRLSLGLPCSTCLPEGEVPPGVEHLDIEERVKKIASRLKGPTVYHYLSALVDMVSELEGLFSKCVGKGFWSLQRTWALRLLKGESFAITAPTGVGKTTLLLVYALYAASRGKKVYVLVPTENLVEQATSKLEEYARKAQRRVRVIGYRTRVSEKLRADLIKRILAGDYDVLVTTTAFLAKRFAELVTAGTRFDVIVVDDADSLLKNTKNVDRVLSLLGFTDEELTLAYELVKLKSLYAYALAKRSPDADDLSLKIEKLRLKLSELRKSGERGQLIVASATGKQFGTKPKLFKELLDFEVGSIQNYMRNVVDAYSIVSSREERDSALRALIEKLGPGGIVLVPRDEGVNEAKRVAEMLNSAGFRAALAVSGKRAVEKLVKGEADVLVGVSSYYGTLVRGIDLPLHIKYVVFTGAPKAKVELRKGLLNPVRVLRIAASLVEHVGKGMVDELARTYSNLSPSERQALRIALLKQERLPQDTKLGRACELFRQAAEAVYEAAWRLLAQNGGGSLPVSAGVIRSEGGYLYLISPDALSYIQASGRASRFTERGMTLGLSVVLETDVEVVRALAKRLEWYVYGFSFKRLEDLDLDSIKLQLHLSRVEGSNNLTYKPARAVLIVVESPTKARTIAGFFGRPARRRLGSRIVAYEIPIVDPERREAYLGIIMATRGHICDLVVDDGIGLYGVVVKSSSIVPVYSSVKRCLKCKEQFSTLASKCPRCGEEVRMVTAREVVQSLRALAFEVDEVLLATDPDSEGEKIAWDVYNAVAPFSRKSRRIEFHEVTRDALIAALRHPREINEHRVMAQVYRRVTDRWIGFSSSSKLWEVFGKRWLGAGRVQIPVLGWIISRYDEWSKSRGYVLKVKLLGGPQLRLFYKSKEEAETTLRSLTAGRVRVLGYRGEVKQVSPQPPLTTDELLYLANSRLGLSTYSTMKIAQELFESGLITYHRTDSTRVSSAGQSIARRFLAERLGAPEAFVPRSWDTGAGSGAHEAIRPTQPIGADELWKRYIEGEVRTAIPLTPVHIKVYDIIFRRFVASQMKQATIIQTHATLEVGGKSFSLSVCTDTLEDGFLLVWPLQCYKELEPALKTGEVVVEVAELERGSSVQLYREGEVVKNMKEKGIGRPSTYAKTLSSLKRHGYVVESRRRKFLIPTKAGSEVYGYLMTNYPALFSEGRTALLEEALRRIEEGGGSELASLTQALLEELKSFSLIEKADRASVITNSIIGLSSEVEAS